MAIFSSPTVAITWPASTLSPSLTVSWATVPPVRTLAGTGLGASTVANTAFSSAMLAAATTYVSAATAGHAKPTIIAAIGSVLVSMVPACEAVVEGRARAATL